MSGHSKWSKVKRKKGAADVKKGKIFSRCIYEIATAVKEGGSADPGSNPRLRFAIDKARSLNMPNENIDRALKRASGEGKADERMELTYEGYGPGGTAVMVDVITDNKNRSAGEVRNAFSRCGGTLGESGSVGWMFSTKGVMLIDARLIDEDTLMESALEAGAEDVSRDDDKWEVITDPKDLYRVREAIKARVKVESAEVERLPLSRISVSGKEGEQMVRLLELLEDLDDVIGVAANCDFADDVVQDD